MDFEFILSGRHSPKNHCFGIDEEDLYLAPGDDVGQMEKYHLFTGSLSGRKSRYGWVKRVDPFSVEQFVKKIGVSDNDEAWTLQTSMLKAISRLKENDAVAADYLPRGLPPIPTLIVHRVIFHL